MCEITATEFKTHFGKYLSLSQSEEIVITMRGKKICTLVPQKEDLKKRLQSYVGLLPPEAAFDNDIDRE